MENMEKRHRTTLNALLQKFGTYPVAKGLSRWEVCGVGIFFYSRIRPRDQRWAYLRNDADPHDLVYCGSRKEIIKIAALTAPETRLSRPWRRL